MKRHRWEPLIIDADVAGALATTTYDRRRSPARKHRSGQLICHIDVSAFLAVMFFLVLLFSIRTPICIMRGSAIDLAKVDNPVWMSYADREDAILVAVMKDGTVYFGSEKQRLPLEIAPLIRKGVESGSEKKVYIKADFRAHYGDVEKVLDEVHAAGIEQVGLIVEKRRPPEPL